MRTSLAVALVVLATALTAGPAVGRDRTLDVDTKVVDFGTLTAPESGEISDAIRVTNNSDETVPLGLQITISKPMGWSEPWNPFIFEDVVTTDWESCNEIAPGATCLIFVTFQTEVTGKFAGSVWINGSERVKLRALAVPEGG